MKFWVNEIKDQMSKEHAKTQSKIFQLTDVVYDLAPVKHKKAIENIRHQWRGLL